MYLQLDTSVRNQVSVTRLDSGVTYLVEVGHTQTLLVIDQALTAWGVAPQAVRGIAVVVGVGSFTATRVATTIANAWAFVYGIPVIAVGVDEKLSQAQMAVRCQTTSRFVSALYSGAPAIGQSATYA